MTLIASQALAQTTVERNLATPTGHDVSVGVSSYTYREPDGDTPISIHAPKFVAEYTGTLSLSRQRHLFMQGQARSTFGNTTYDGWCSPFFIAPNGQSPNGYELDIGDPSTCNESGDRDWYVEGRARRQGFHRPAVGLVAVQRDWASPLIEWHDRQPRVPHR